MSYSQEELKIIREMLFKMADDQLIIGHRNSEWTGLGPILEEDIAFSSIAQDKIGQSQALYTILSNMGEADPDTLGFMRGVGDFKCCHLVEFPIGEYDFSLMRNFLFSHSEHIRFEMLSDSAFEPVAKLARKIKGEIKYHTMHADTWIKQLGNANEESHAKMQRALDSSFNLGLGIFEPGINDEILAGLKVFDGEKSLQEKWLEAISPVLERSSLKMPDSDKWKPSFGGREGKHTQYLKPLLNEMSEVLRIDPETEW